MVQGHGVVLEGGVAVRHGGVPGVAGLGEEAEVRDPEPAHDLRPGRPGADGSRRLDLGMDHHGPVEGDQGTEARDEEG